MDLPEIWPDPVPQVVECLRTCDGWEDVMRAIPDIALVGGDR
jgi:hypothetical protein